MVLCFVPFIVMLYSDLPEVFPPKGIPQGKGLRRRISILIFRKTFPASRLRRFSDREDGKDGGIYVRKAMHAGKGKP